MEGGSSSAAAAASLGVQDHGQQQQQQQQNVEPVEKLNPAVQQQLNLQSVKTRAIGLFKAISRILEELDVMQRTNSTPKWQDVLGQFSMVNLELFNIVEDIKKVSKAFVVHPKNVNAENATILPVMLSSKLLPEMEVEDNIKGEQLLQGMQHLPIQTQIEKLKARIDMIGAACESAEKVIADARKAYGLGTRQAPTILPTIDKVQAAKILEQENILRAAVYSGLRMQPDPRQIPTSLPAHLVDVLTVGDGSQSFSDASGMYPKNAASSNNVNNQGTILQPMGAQLSGRSIPSPSGPTGVTSFDNMSTSPLPYANSPRSGTNIMNTPSPQQQTQQQQQLQQQQQQQLQQQQQQQQQQQLQRQKMMQLGQQQLLAQQQFRQSSAQGLGQVHGQMQYSQPLAQQFQQGRQLQSGHVQNNLVQTQLNQGNLRNQLSQYAGTASGSLFNAAQTSPNSQLISNLSATMQSNSLLPRMQYGLSGAHQQRTHASQILSDQMFNIGGTNQNSLMQMQQQQQQQQQLQQQQQQQQHGTQGGFSNLSSNPQNLQSNMVTLQNVQNASQNSNFTQQRQQQNQQ